MVAALVNRVESKKKDIQAVKNRRSSWQTAQ
jgi:hypothetical protein